MSRTNEEMMSWRAMVDEAYARRGRGSRPRHGLPISADALARVERGLSRELPGELRELLLEANGIMELIDVGGSWVESMWIVWPASELCERNIELRRKRGEGRFPANALAFSGAGADGIIFAFDARPECTEVLAWDPIAAECSVKARSLREFLRGWIAGEISV